MKKILNYVNCFLCICISILVTGIPVYAADAIDVEGKKEATHHIISETEWRKLVKRYPV